MGKFESEFTDTIVGVVALSDEINKGDINSTLTKLSSLINNGQIWVEPVTKGSDAGIQLLIAGGIITGTSAGAAEAASVLAALIAVIKNDKN